MLCWDLIIFFATQKAKRGSSKKLHILGKFYGNWLIPLKWCALFSLKVNLRASKMASYIFWVYRKRAEKFTWGSIWDLASHFINFGLSQLVWKPRGCWKMHGLPCQVPSKWFWKLRPFPLQNGSVKKRRGRIYSRVIPGTPKDMGPIPFPFL